MRLRPKLLIFNILVLAAMAAQAQRTYSNVSVLSGGSWTKIGVAKEGIYKVDAAFLNSLGLGSNFPSSQLRLFSNGGGMLPESNASIPVDDLKEVAISVVDGGDGVINGGDYFLFYGQGPDRWIKDSAASLFRHQKNLYSNKTFYFLTIGGAGLRVPTAPSSSGGVPVTSFNEHYFHELDSINFLASGKQWYGEEFSSAPGRSLSYTFPLPLPNLLPQNATLISSVVARSINISSSFTVVSAGGPVQQILVPQVSSGLYDRFVQEKEELSSITLSSNPSLTYIYTPGSFNSQGWLNWFELHARRSLSFDGTPLFFRDWSSVGSGTAEFTIQATNTDVQVWDLTDPFRPVRMGINPISVGVRFSNSTARLREYVCFSGGFLAPTAEGVVPNQNLHSTTEQDMIIVTAPQFLSEAQRLAQFHQQRDGLKTVIATTTQIFNEFSGGIPDPTAIRDYVKMYHDRYASVWKNKGRYLLLLGRGSYDYKNRIASNTNLVPVYETPSSIDPLSTYTSDDFFGFLEDAEDINSGVIINTLDIGIGRVPAANVAEVKNYFDKIMDYHSGAALGPWRNSVDFIADDEDFDIHLQDAELMTATVRTTAPEYNIQKIYLDAFQQEGGSSGGRYPQANAMVNNNIYNGTLVWNYSGHGGPPRLAEEVIIDQSIVSSWNNRFKLPLFITATCDFAPFDNPVIASLGENLLMRPATGAIALMTTTRVVFAFSNRIMNNNYLKYAFEKDTSGKYRTLGQALQEAKNFTYQTSGDVSNNRKFALLGDPALTLAFPEHRVTADRINGKDLSLGADTLSATELVTIEGSVRDKSGVVMPSFNGRVYLSLYDKVRTVTTLANDPSSSPVPYADQSSILFKGKATVTNGAYSIQFRVPKDINFQYGPGRISLYAENGVDDAHGISGSAIIGSIAGGLIIDTEGPEIKAFLNDENFVNGSISNEAPVLLLKLFDSSGINTGSSGIDHDIVATLDDDPDTYYVLNNFYESDLDSYQKGTVRFQLPKLKSGAHTLKIKAWDVVNNSSEYLLNFTVVEGGELRIDHVLNYPNPFTTRTAFWFEHNRPATDLRARVEVYTVSGKLIKTLSQTINTPGNRSMDIEWDGRDDAGSRIGRGVYIYKLTVRGGDGKVADAWQKLVIL